MVWEKSDIQLERDRTNQLRHGVPDTVLLNRCVAYGRRSLCPNVHDTCREIGIGYVGQPLSIARVAACFSTRGLSTLRATDHHPNTHPPNRPILPECLGQLPVTPRHLRRTSLRTAPSENNPSTKQKSNYIQAILGPQPAPAGPRRSNRDSNRNRPDLIRSETASRGLSSSCKHGTIPAGIRLRLRRDRGLVPGKTDQDQCRTNERANPAPRAPA